LGEPGNIAAECRDYFSVYLSWSLTFHPAVFDDESLFLLPH
jgi:hypothetical protein